MKKILVIISFVSILCSCHKSSDFYDGFTGSNYETFALGERFLIELSDNLIIDNLKALESAIAFDSYGYWQGTGYSECSTNGRSLWDKDAEWVLGFQPEIKGVKLEKMPADSTWRLSRQGDYFLGGDYPTSYVMTVRMHKESIHMHYTWDVMIEGDRTEEEGYSCHFWTEAPMSYLPSKSYIAQWDACYGSIIMEVSKHGKKIDKTRLEYFGGKNERRYFRGL